MTVKASGSLSIEEIVTEFGGSDPDALDEYYRGAGLVTENNTGVPASGEMSMDAFYSTQLIYAKLITASANNIVLSDYFTEAEWVSSAPKSVTINAGVTIGSTSSGVVSCRTGTTVGAQPMGGTLELIINGYIYGAGGAIGGAGGDALQAQVILTVTNNSRIYGGGGGGGDGGIGESCYYFPEDTTWKDPAGTVGTWWWIDTLNVYSVYYLMNVFSDAGNPSSVDDDGYTYFRGAFSYSEEGFWPGSMNYYYYIRRRFTLSISGGIGGIGGVGLGSNQASSSGSTGSTPTNGVKGGDGGNGGGWGASGANGDTGGSVDPLYQETVSGPTSGTTGGISGNYIVGNANVTWNVTGDRLGLVA